MEKILKAIMCVYILYHNNFAQPLTFEAESIMPWFSFHQGFSLVEYFPYTFSLKQSCQA